MKRRSWKIGSLTTVLLAFSWEESVLGTSPQKSQNATVNVTEEAFHFEDVSEAHLPQASPQKRTPSASGPATVPSAARGNFVFEDTSDIHRTPYEIDVQGPVPAAVLKDFYALGILFQDKDKRLVCAEQAWQLAKQDAATLEDLCAKAGYFDAMVSVNVLTLSNKGIAHFRITFHAVLGERYRIAHMRMTGSLSAHPCLKRFQKKHFSNVHEPVNFARLIAERHHLKAELQNVGAYLVHVQEPDVVIDRAAREASVTFTYDNARRTRIRKVLVTGNGPVPEAFIRNRLAFRAGSVLTKKAVEYSQEDLINSGLLSRVHITVEPEETEAGFYAEATPPSNADHADFFPDEDQPVLVTVDVAPAAPRTLGLGAYLSASEGPMASALWQHKNAFRKAIELGAIARIGHKELSAMTFLNVPDVFGRQGIHADVTLKHYNTRAFEGDKISATAGFVYKARLGSYPVTFSILPTVERAKLTRKESYQRTLGGVILSSKFDFTNHPLYPTAGISVQLGCEPYFGKFSKIILKNANDKKSESIKEVNKNVHSMTIFTGKICGYVPLSHHATADMNGTVLAAFASVGKILIKDLDYVPFDKRFYGGGRNSIRAYGYQLCSRYDDEDNPIGEASLFEACLEPRVRLSEDWGVVAFVEVSASPFSKTQSTSPNRPTFLTDKRKPLWGIGFGFRYFTRFGPIRFDVGIPCSRRDSLKEKGKKIDKPLQFYISIGQSF